MNKIKFILITFIIFNKLIFSQDNISNDYEEGIFTLKYSIFKKDINVILKNDSIYIPLFETLSFLKIYCNFNKDNNIIFGYIGNATKEYEIDLKKMIYVNFNGFRNSIKKDQYLKSETDIYFTPFIISTLLSVDVNIFYSNLVVKIISDFDLPILELEKKYNKYANLTQDESLEDNKILPLVYERNFQIIDGGILTYNISGSQNRDNQNFNYNTNLGIQLIGGEFLYNATGGFNYQGKEFSYGHNFRWRYSFEENKYISYIFLGDVTNISTRSRSVLYSDAGYSTLRGIQISNENTIMPTVFNSFNIEGRTEPGWQVELYINNQLFAQMLSDNLGYYSFKIPVKYGNTNVELKFYGKNGEFVSKSQVINVPSEFIRPGDFKYIINAGKELYHRKYNANGSIALGITNWLTSTFQLQKVDSLNERDFVNMTSLRLFDGFIINTLYSPKNYYSGGLRLQFEDFGAYELNYTKFLYSFDILDSLSSYKMNNSQKIDFSAGLPRFFSLPFNLTLRGSKQFNNNFSFLTLNSNLGLYISNITFGAYYQIRHFINKVENNKLLIQNISPRLDYSWYEKPNYLSFLGNTRISFGCNYSIDKRELSDISFSIQQEFLKQFNMCINYSRNIQQKSNFASISFNMIMPFLRGNVNAQTSNYYNSVSENISGTIGFSPDRLKFYFGNQNNNSNSNGAALIRFFVDNNNNERYDKGEVELPEVEFYIKNATVENDKKGDKKIFNLIPAARYNLYVKKESIMNPFIVPKYMEFSFIADPYSFKVIDVPCYMTGSVEGFVYYFNDGAKIGQGGIRVHLVNLDDQKDQTIDLFSDGSFYKIGILPGKYKIYIDSLQLRLLDVYSEPNEIIFEIKSTSEGDNVSGLDFRLISKNSEKVQNNDLQKNVNTEQNQKQNDTLIALSKDKIDKDEVIISKNEIKKVDSISNSNKILSNNNEGSGTILSGRVVIYDFADSDQNTLVEKKLKLTCIMKLTNGISTLYSNCDSEGKFFFDNISPGKWTLSLFKGGLPEGHIIEKMFQTIEIKKNEKFNILYRILPLKK